MALRLVAVMIGCSPKRVTHSSALDHATSAYDAGTTKKSGCSSRFAVHLLLRRPRGGRARLSEEQAKATTRHTSALASELISHDSLPPKFDQRYQVAAPPIPDGARVGSDRLQPRRAYRGRQPFRVSSTRRCPQSRARGKRPTPWRAAFEWYGPLSGSMEGGWPEALAYRWRRR